VEKKRENCKRKTKDEEKMEVKRVEKRYCTKIKKWGRMYDFRTDIHYKQ
jgi:hypothetical protein